MRENVTLEEARDRSLVLLRSPNDGSVSPQLLMSVVEAINDAQRTIHASYAWLCDRRRQVVTLTAGRRFYDLAPLLPGRIEAIHVIKDGVAIELASTITADMELATYGPPQGYTYRSTPGLIGVKVKEGGSGYVDGSEVVVGGGGPEVAAAATLVAPGGAVEGIAVSDAGAGYTGKPTLTLADGTGAVLQVLLADVTELVLAPVPDEAYTLWVDALVGPTPISEPNDLLIYDSQAVVKLAAATVAEAWKMPHAAGLMGKAVDYINGRRRSESSGSGFTFGSR